MPGIRTTCTRGPGRRVVSSAVRALAAALLAVTTARAQTNGPPPTSNTEDFQPNIKPTLVVERANGPVEIDGDLQDAGWIGAARADNFAENWPREQAKPPVESEAWVTYDDRNLYVALIAHDDPATIRASLRDRDEIWSDDYFGLLLDTYGDAAWAYYLFANPLGVQGDSRFASAIGEDDSFDLVYQSEARITERGYQIEIAIPFESLRFPDRPEQTWRVTFWRTRPRDSRAQYTWAAIDRDDQCFLCQFGRLTGIEGVKPGGALELMPGLVASQSGSLADPDDPTSGFEDHGIDGEASLGVRYSFANGLTAEGTVNPDFSQVESDAGQIDVNTTFALFFPERRPFFNEGSDLYTSPFFDVVYTRQINDPQFAWKFIGRVGRTNIAYMGGRDEHSPILLPFEERSFVGQAGRSISNIARVRQTFGTSSYVGAMLTDRRFENGPGSGTTYGIDGVFRVFDKYRLEYQFLGSHTREPDDPALTDGVNGLLFDDGRYTAAFDGESFSGFAQYTSFERDARFWNFDIDYWAASPTFRADNGFETRNDYRRVFIWQALNFYPNTGLVQEIEPSLNVSRDWDYDGLRKTEFFEPMIGINLAAQTYFRFEYRWMRERFQGIDFGGIRRWFVLVESNFSDPVKGGFWILKGRQIARNEEPPVLGTGTEGKVWATFKPMLRLVIAPSIAYIDLHELDGGPELFSGYILRTRTSLQFTRELFLRIIVEYNDFAERLSVEPLLTYKVNPFTLFFIGATSGYRYYDDPNEFAQTSRQIFMKFQYLFRK